MPADSTSIALVESWAFLLSGLTLRRARELCYSEIWSRPAVAHALNDDVVNDRAHARSGFGSQLGRFLLLDRLDKAPQIDGPVLNGDRQHGRPPWLRSHPRRDLFTQFEVIYSQAKEVFWWRSPTPAECLRG